MYKAHARSEIRGREGNILLAILSLPSQPKQRQPSRAPGRGKARRWTPGLVLRKGSLLSCLTTPLCATTSPTADLLSPVTASPQPLLFVPEARAMERHGGGAPPKLCLGPGTYHNSSSTSIQLPPAIMSLQPVCSSLSTTEPTLSDELRSEPRQSRTHSTASAARAARPRAGEQMLGQPQQDCWPAEDGFGTLGPPANQSWVPGR